MAKEFSRLMLRDHRAQQAAESARLKMKLAAIQALPRGRLRDAAMEPDFTPFPTNRIAASLTPPLQELVDEREAADTTAVPVRKIR